jgi:hypothetical protein
MKPIYKLHDWIDDSKLMLHFVCEINHPAIIPILTKYKHNLDSHCFFRLCHNEYVIDYITENPDQIDNLHWTQLSTNPHAIKFLEKNPGKIQWGWLSTNPAAIHLLEKNRGKINWHMLSKNPAAIHLLEENLDKINWELLACNPAPAAKELLEKKPEDPPKLESDSSDSSDWGEPLGGRWETPEYEEPTITIGSKTISFSDYLKEENVKFLKENPDKIFWRFISNNPAIFIYDYSAMRWANQTLSEELASVVFHPKRVARFLEAGGNIDDL